MNDRKLEGRTALVTGAASGIGAAIAQLFAQHGARLVLNDLDGDRLQRFLATLPGQGHAAVAGDISLGETSAEMSRQALEHTGRIDVLVNNAAMLHCRDITETPLEEYERVMRVNVGSLYHACRVVLPTMVSQHRGVIVNVASVSGLAAMEFDGQSTWLYSTSKSAVYQFTRSLASRYAADGIRVNAVAPGPTRTSQLKNMLPGLSPEQEAQMWDATGGEKTLLGRVGRPEEIATVALFLACDDSSFVTGTHVLADGGYLVR